MLSDDDMSYALRYALYVAVFERCLKIHAIVYAVEFNHPLRHARKRKKPAQYTCCVKRTRSKREPI